MNFHKLVKGALIIARKDKLIIDQLANTKAAENARTVRATYGKRAIQKRGVIRVEECRKMTLKRKEDRLETARQNKVILNQRKAIGASKKGIDSKDTLIHPGWVICLIM